MTDPNDCKNSDFSCGSVSSKTGKTQNLQCQCKEFNIYS